MLRYVLRRLVTSFALLILGSMVVFLLMRVIPGDPTITKLGGSIKEVDKSTLDGIRAELGLDKSIPAQYVDWVSGILHGDFGASYFSQFSVTSLVEQRYGATLLLAFMSMIIGILIAVPASVAGAIWPNRILGGLLSGFAAVGIAIPTFVIGIGLIIVLGVELEWLPTQGYVSFQADPDRERQVDPAARDHTRDRGRGGDDADPAAVPLRRRQLVVRANGQGKGPAATAGRRPSRAPERLDPGDHGGGIIVAHLVGGAVIIEYVFARPGLGSLLVDSVYQRDYGVLQALVLLAVAVFIVTSLIVDVLLGFIDPRLRTKAVT